MVIQKLDAVVPWGRSFNEYVNMFALTAEDFERRILDCGGGPASFNAELTDSGCEVVACDPVYTFSAEQIAQRIDEIYPVIIAATEANKDNYIWREIPSPEALGRIRLAAMRRFLDDFPEGVRDGRYVAAALPTLPFETKQFGLVLCSHFLFTYSDQLSADFHLASIVEMCRVAPEARIFPLLDQFTCEVSPLLEPTITALERLNYDVAVEHVPYEFQRGGNQMLRVSRHVP